MGKFSVKSHTVMQNVFAGHDVQKRFNEYSNQIKLSKREANLQILLTYLS